MKSLNKMIASAAAMATMWFGANAAEKEVQYGPTSYNGGEIDNIELVNGHILVRSNGKIPGQDVPYMYTSTNIQDYATSAFAQGGATNVAKYVHAGNGKIYMTFKNVNGIYTTQIAKEFGPGVVEVDEKNPQTQEITKYAIRKVGSDELSAAQAALNGNTGSTNSGLTVNIDGDTYTYKQNPNGIWLLYKGEERVKEDFMGGSQMKEDNATPEQIFLINVEGSSKKRLYILGRDTQNVKRIYTADGKPLDGTAVDQVSVLDNKLVYKDHETQETKVYNPFAAQGKEKVVGVPADAKSVVVAGDRIYYATAKKLGVKTMD